MFEDIMRTIASPLGIPEEVTRLNRHWKMKQKMISAVAAHTLDQDKFVYLMLQASPDDGAETGESGA